MAGLLAASCLAFSLTLNSQSGTEPPAHSYDARAIAAAKSAIQPRLIALRDAFVKAAADSGLSCAVAPPTLAIEETPSFGNYSPETNTLHTGVWEELEPRERALFYTLAHSKSDEGAARREFETGAHHWVFIHEMGHWWQSCRKVNDGRKPYAFEYEADRIAAAYWRQADLAIVQHMKAVFQGLVDHSPNPLPPGQETASYFNDNYEKLGPTPAYIWFQSEMCVTAFRELPPPSFVQTLRETGYP